MGTTTSAFLAFDRHSKLQPHFATFSHNFALIEVNVGLRFSFEVTRSGHIPIEGAQSYYFTIIVIYYTKIKYGIEGISAMPKRTPNDHSQIISSIKLKMR